MNIRNIEDDTPPFNQWIFIDFGEYMTFGRILEISPNDEFCRSEFLSFDRGEDIYEEYQFYVQLMHTKNELDIVSIYNDENSGYFESDFSDYFSDSIKGWALKPY
jgi:hypothetical protein